MWKRARQMVENRPAAAPSNSAAPQPSAPVRTDGAQRQTMIDAFLKRHGFRLPLEGQPSDETLGWALRSCRAKTVALIPLDRVTTVGDGIEAWSEPRRLKGTPFLYEDFSMRTQKGDFWTSPECFVHAITVLMNAYVLASLLGPPSGSPWCTIEAAQTHTSTVERWFRYDSKTGGWLRKRLMEIETTIRREWLNLNQENPKLSLAEVIKLVSDRRNFWPMKSEFPAEIKGAAATVPLRGVIHTVTKGSKGSGKGTARQNLNRIAQQNAARALRQNNATPAGRALQRQLD